jgi:hypothetical protein
VDEGGSGATLLGTPKTQSGTELERSALGAVVDPGFIENPEVTTLDSSDGSACHRGIEEVVLDPSVGAMCWLDTVCLSSVLRRNCDGESALRTRAACQPEDSSRGVRLGSVSTSGLVTSPALDS